MILSYSQPRSTVHEHVNRELMSDINMDSELKPIDKAEHPSLNVPENKSETSINQEPAQLFLVPERNFGKDPLCDPVTDNDMYLDENCNDQVNEPGSLPRKQNDKIVEELPGMKMGCKDGQLKAIEEVPAKKKAEKAARSGKSTKPTPLAEAQSQGQQSHSLKAGLQKTKKEKEEDERKRIEDLKTHRQRIAGKTASSVNKLATNSHLPRQQQLKPVPTSDLSVSNQKSRTDPLLSRAHSLPKPVKKDSNEAIIRLSSHKETSNHLSDTVSQSISYQSGLKSEDSSTPRQSKLVSPAKQTTTNVKKSSKQINSSKTEIGGNVKANDKSSISSKTVTKVFNEKAMHSDGSNILNKENGSISNVKKNSNQTPVLQMEKQGDRLKANAVVSESTANGLDNPDSKKNQSLAANKIALPVKKLNGGSLKVPLDLKGRQKNHPDSSAIQALCNGEESNLDNSAVNDKSKEHTDVCVTEKHINDSKSQNEENNEPLKSDYWKTTEDKEQVKGSNLDYSSGNRGTSTPLIEVAMSDSPDSTQLDVQPDHKNGFQSSSFKLQRSDSEEPSEATVVHASSLDDPDSNSFEFRLTPENDIPSEEIRTPKLSTFELGKPLTVVSDSANARPQLHRVVQLPPVASPVTDNEKLDSPHSRRKWGHSENTAKAFRRLLMFGRKSRNSHAEKNVDGSREGQVGV